MRKSLLLTSRAALSIAAPAIIAPSYANTLTPLIPQIYAALDVVSRELVGFIPGAGRDSSVERAAVGQSVAYPIAPVQVAYDIVPAMQVPTPPDNTWTTGTMAITKSRAVPFGITGEEQRGLGTGGPGMLTVQAQWIAQALRTLTNEIELDLAVEASAKASRAYGTAGTTPFASDLSDTAQVRKILDDNGAPLYGRSLVINTAAGAKVRTLTQLTKVNEAGSQMTLRDGQLLDIHGFAIRESGQTVNHTKGTGAAPTTNAAGYAIGATVITLASASTGTIVAGDVITFAGDTNKYNVISGDADVSNGGTITIAKPGLRIAIPAAATAITLGNTYAANVAFTSDALHLAMRAPALPQEGDSAVDRRIITDIRSGMQFEFAIYLGYKMVRYEIGAAWGVHASKSEHMALLLG